MILETRRSQQQHGANSVGSGYFGLVVVVVVTTAVGVGVADLDPSAQTVGAPAGQTTAAQTQSEAAMSFVQEMAFCDMSQQQQASVGLGLWS